ncbi:MAG: NTP transferase domain-containing protein [Nitrosopumilus sp.]|jgi:adenosylcobinamide-phosphate guanylyltransferase|nr:NTP transferase domain-containing protein [Nitrosopumilus sp.]
MIGIVMAGGKGSRMPIAKEKLLLEYKKPIIIHVIDALKESKCFSKIIAVTSSNSPETKKLLQRNNIELFNSYGHGYVKDLNQVLTMINDPVLVSSGDLPLLDGKIIQNIVKQYNPENIWTSFLITKEFLSSLKISTEYEINFNNQTCCYTGISLINAEKISHLKKIPENFIVFNDKRIGFNLNTKEDYDLLSTT